MLSHFSQGSLTISRVSLVRALHPSRLFSSQVLRQPQQYARLLDLAVLVLALAVSHDVFSPSPSPSDLGYLSSKLSPPPEGEINAAEGVTYHRSKTSSSPYPTFRDTAHHDRAMINFACSLMLSTTFGQKANEGLRRSLPSIRHSSGILGDDFGGPVDRFGV